METKIIKVDSDDFKIEYSRIDDIDTIRYKVASELKFPYFFLKLKDNPQNTKIEEVKLNIPFKKITKITKLTDLENMTDIAFTTLESLVEKNKKNNFFKNFCTRNVNQIYF